MYAQPQTHSQASQKRFSQLDLPSPAIVNICPSLSPDSFKDLPRQFGYTKFLFLNFFPLSEM